MDRIQKYLVKKGRSDLAQFYYEKYAALKDAYFNFGQPGATRVKAPEVPLKSVAKGDEYEVFQATKTEDVQKLSRGTAWDLQNKEFAKQRLKYGAVYFVKKDGKIFAAFHNDSETFFDVRDVKISEEDTKNILKIWPEGKYIARVLSLV